MRWLDGITNSTDNEFEQALGNSGNNGCVYLFIYFLAPKSLQMVIAAMKLKHAYSLEEKL